MMRWLIGLLVVLNVLVFLYGHLRLGQGSRSPSDAETRVRPDVGSIRLVAVRVADRPVAPHASPPEALPPASATAPISIDTAPSDATKSTVEPAPEASETDGPSVMAGQEQPSASPAAEGPLVVPARSEEMEEPAEPAESSRLEPEAKETTPDAAEAAQETNAPKTEAGEVPVPAVSSRYCGEVGPFRSRAQARRLLRTLGLESGFELYKRPTPVVSTWWVYIPPAADRKVARRMVERLKAAGVTDLWLMPDGEWRNAISLGLYSREGAARGRAEALRKQGFEVEIKPRTTEKMRYWIRFHRQPDSVVQRLEKGLQEGRTIEYGACEEASP